MMNQNGPVMASLIGPMLFNKYNSNLDHINMKPVNDKTFHILLKSQNHQDCLQTLINYNYILVFVTLIILVCTIVYYPEFPNKPVSRSATVKRLNISSSMIELSKKIPFINIMLSASLIVGMNGSLTGLFPMIVFSKGMTESESGIINFVAGIMVIFGTTIFGILNDKLYNLRGGLLKSIFIIQCVILIIFNFY